MQRFLVLLLILWGMILTGCGPAFAPVHATYERSVDYAPAGGMTVAPGESLMKASGSYRQPAFMPRTSMTPTAVRDLVPDSMERDKAWVAWWRLDDGTHVVQPPAGYADGYGLRVDEYGTVVGRRPWMDVRDQVRPSQENWEQKMRGVFRPAPGYKVDTFLFDLIYRGEKYGQAVIEQQAVKVGDMLRPMSEVRVIPVPGRFRFQDWSIEVIEADAEKLRYRIEPDLR